MRANGFNRNVAVEMILPEDLENVLSSRTREK